MDINLTLTNFSQITSNGKYASSLTEELDVVLAAYLIIVGKQYYCYFILLYIIIILYHHTLSDH